MVGVLSLNQNSNQTPHITVTNYMVYQRSRSKKNAFLVHNHILHTVTMGSCPFSEWCRLSASSALRPTSSRSGRLTPRSRAVDSAHARILTSWRIAASRLVDCLSRIARLTLSAASRRSSGSSSAASCGSRVSGGNRRRAMVFSSSSRNLGFVGARGPSCSVANFSTGLISLPVVVQPRMSSTSCKRSREKCSALSVSRICTSVSLRSRHRWCDKLRYKKEESLKKWLFIITDRMPAHMRGACITRVLII